MINKPQILEIRNTLTGAARHHAAVLTVPAMAVLRFLLSNEDEHVADKDDDRPVNKDGSRLEPSQGARPVDEGDGHEQTCCEDAEDGFVIIVAGVVVRSAVVDDNELCLYVRVDLVTSFSFTSLLRWSFFDTKMER
jgi:hypothetical protein